MSTKFFGIFFEEKYLSFQKMYSSLKWYLNATCINICHSMPNQPKSRNLPRWAIQNLIEFHTRAPILRVARVPNINFQLEYLPLRLLQVIIYTTDLFYFYTIKYMHTFNFILHSNIQNEFPQVVLIVSFPQSQLHWSPVLPRSAKQPISF